MSLDVYLHQPACDKCGQRASGGYSANITHNLNRMAEEAGIYQHLWRPEEVAITHARQLIEPLRAGIALMKADPERFIAFEPANGWGRYIHFVPWLERYLAACEMYSRPSRYRAPVVDAEPKKRWWAPWSKRAQSKRANLATRPATGDDNG